MQVSTLVLGGDFSAVKLEDSVHGLFLKHCLRKANLYGAENAKGIILKDYLEYYPADAKIQTKENLPHLKVLLKTNAPPPQLIILIYPFFFPVALKWMLQIISRWTQSPFILGVWGEPYVNPLFCNICQYNLSLSAPTSSNQHLLSSLLNPAIGFMVRDSIEKINSTANNSIDISYFHPWQNEDDIELNSKILSYLRSQKKHKFCNFVYSNNATSYFDGVQKRNEICKALMEYRQVDCAGYVLNNTDDLRKIEESNHEWLNPLIEEGKDKIDRKEPGLSKLKYIANYKFTIAGENCILPYYITEKIIQPLAVGSIPIYSGSANISRLINPKAFINAADYASLDELVNHVSRVDQDDSLYYEYLKQPIFHQDSIAYDYYSDRGQEKMFFGLGKKIIAHIQKYHLKQNPKENVNLTNSRNLSSPMPRRNRRSLVGQIYAIIVYKHSFALIYLLSTQVLRLIKHRTKDWLEKKIRRLKLIK